MNAMIPKSGPLPVLPGSFQAETSSLHIAEIIRGFQNGGKTATRKSAIHRKKSGIRADSGVWRMGESATAILAGPSPDFL
jgi:hypothetical protein